VKLREEHGFGLIELLIAMVVLNIGLLALVAAFQSSAFALRRASHVSTAATLADTQMELYRGLTYAQIVLDPALLANVDNTYKCDSALGSSCPNSTGAEQTGTCTGPADACNPSRLVTTYGDRYGYRVDTYIVSVTPSNCNTTSPLPPAGCNSPGRVEKKVTVVVRDKGQLAKTLARATSTFDQTISG
jgi:Tfp pilus assembly protein PilV